MLAAHPPRRLCGGGSPVMEDIAIMGTYDMKSKKNLAKYLAGIKE